VVDTCCCECFSVLYSRSHVKHETNLAFMRKIGYANSAIEFKNMHFLTDGYLPEHISLKSFE